MEKTNLTVTEKSNILHLVDKLCSDNGLERKDAMKELVKIGHPVLDYLSEMLSAPKHKYQWEALKVTEEIGDPHAIPVFLKFLEDENSDLRWIAAEGLIRIGRESIGPLLNLISEKYDSVFVLDGAHHVFYDLNVEKLLPKDFPVDKLLKDLKSSGKSERLKLLVYQIKRDFKYHSANSH